MKHHANRVAVIFVLTLLVVLTGSSPSLAGEVREYTVIMTHAGAATPVQVNAWLPTEVPIRGVLYISPGTNGDSRVNVASVPYQSMARALGLAMIGMEDRDFLSYFQGDNETEARANVQKMLNRAALELGCPQLTNAAILFYGFSKGGLTSNRLADYMPERTVCFFTDKSTASTSTLDADTRLIPGLFVGGSQDHISDPPFVLDGFQVWRTIEGGAAALAVDWHEDTMTHQATRVGLIGTFLDECLSLRCPTDRLPSTVPDTPMPIDAIDPAAGWLVETIYGSDYTWLRCPEAAPVGSYSLDAAEAGWLPSKLMAMVVRAHSAADPLDGAPPVRLTARPIPAPETLTYELGDTIDLEVTNVWLNEASVTAVRIYYRDEIIGESTTLPASGVQASHRLLERGVHTFRVEVDYVFENEPTCASDYVTVRAAAPVTTMDPFQKCQGKLDFRRADRDGLKYRCSMNLPRGFDPDGAVLAYDIGGVTGRFTFDASGGARDGSNKAKLKGKARQGVWVLTLALKRGDFAAAWADEGLTDATVLRDPATMGARFRVAGAVFERTSDLLYTARAGRGGKARQR